MLGMPGDQFGAGLRERAARIMLIVPRTGDDPGEKIVEPGAIGNQLFVEVARIPVDQDMADVENDGARRLAQP